MILMDRSHLKSQLMNFLLPLIVCKLIGYLSHDDTGGVSSGIGIGIGFVIGHELIGKW